MSRRIERIINNIGIKNEDKHPAFKGLFSKRDFILSFVFFIFEPLF